jgi:PST family polysaccharide transporter
MSESPGLPQAASVVEGFRAGLHSGLQVPQGRDFKRKSIRGGASALLSQVVSMALTLLTTIILARILSPSDYGLQAMVLSLTGFLSLFKEAGLSAASVQREKLNQTEVSTLFWINVAIGAVLSVVVACLAPALVRFYKDERLYGITLLSAPIFFVNSLSIQHRALLDRAMRFTTNYTIDIVSVIAGTIIALGLAQAGWGYWALIVQNVSLPVTCTIGAWIAMPWIPGRPRWTHELKHMLRFGGTVTLNNFIGYFSYNAEKILLGHFWGAGPLGIYGRGYQLSNLPMQQMSTAVGSVAFPALSRLQSDPERLRRFHLKAHSLVVSVTVPIVIGIALFAEDIIAVVLGPRWNGVAPILRLLAPAMLAFALISPLNWLLRATGRVRRQIHINMLIFPVMILGIFAGIHFGPVGVAAGYSTAMLTLVLPVLIWALQGTGISLRAYWDVIRAPLAAGLLGGFAGWCFHRAEQTSISVTLLLFGELSIAFVVYALVLLFVMRQKDLYIEVFSQLRSSATQ